MEERHFLTLIRMRTTIASSLSFPPSIEEMMKSFEEKHHEKAKLSVGARALAKHSNRSSDGWWGALVGSEEVKNKKAVEKVVYIIENAIWINSHLLPHEVKIIELRVKEGFGARWTAEGNFFRGFLEPQMADGHSKGWRH